MVNADKARAISAVYELMGKGSAIPPGMRIMRLVETVAKARPSVRDTEA